MRVSLAEVWQSGLMQRSWKPSRVYALREFESHHFRHSASTKAWSKQHTTTANPVKSWFCCFFCLQGQQSTTVRNRGTQHSCRHFCRHLKKRGCRMPTKSLTDARCKAFRPLPDKDQKVFDGGGLFLFVSKTGSKIWRMAYRFNNKPKTISFGPYPEISLSCSTTPRLCQSYDR